VEFKINLIAPAAGDRFVASANVVRSGRTLTIVETDVSAEIGGETKIVAKMLATLICIENTPDRIAS
jgi:acyl-coenzyme A thioesterase PaaI-like protein